MSAGFTPKHKRSTKAGYGNRVAVICNACGKTVHDTDVGNFAGQRWDAIYREKAMDEHSCLNPDGATA